MEPPKSCPHLEVKYYDTRSLKMDSKGITARLCGWYCTWCQQEFEIARKGESDGAKPKSSK